MAAQSLTALMVKVAKGDRLALARLYDQTSPLVYSLALQAVPNATDAEEVVLEVYMLAWRMAHAYDAAAGSVNAWLAAATRKSAMEWTSRHPSRENRAMDEYARPMLAHKGAA